MSICYIIKPQQLGQKQDIRFRYQPEDGRFSSTDTSRRKHQREKELGKSFCRVWCFCSHVGSIFKKVGFYELTLVSQYPYYLSWTEPNSIKDIRQPNIFLCWEARPFIRGRRKYWILSNKCLVEFPAVSDKQFSSDISGFKWCSLAPECENPMICQSISWYPQRFST